MDKYMNQTRANILLLLTSFVWGAGFIASQMALDANITPFQIIAGRFFVASIVLNTVFFKQVKTLKLFEIKAGCIVGFCLFGGFMFQTFGLVYTSPSINAFVTAVYVVLIPFISWVIYKRRPDMYSNISAVLTVLGIGFISLNEGLAISIGIPLTLICAVFYAFQLITTDKYSKLVDPIKLTVVMINFNFIVGLIMTIIFAAVKNDLPKPTVSGIGSIIYLGLFSTSLAFLFQNIGQKYTTAVKAAILMSLEAVFGAALSAVIYKELFNVQMIFGCVLIFGAIIISETKLEFLYKKKRESF